MRDSASRSGPRTGLTTSVSGVPGKFPLNHLPFLTFLGRSRRAKVFEVRLEHEHEASKSVVFSLNVVPSNLKEPGRDQAHGCEGGDHTEDVLMA